jgi:phosphoribosylformylglycinamidine synthase
MKFGVVIFPGSNCDEDVIDVLGRVMQQPVARLWHKEKDLQDSDCIVLPGGFSYGDYLRSGAIARFSPVMEAVVEFANRGGLVLGICNGFQILTESGLLPGVLLRNNNLKFNCKNVHISVASRQSPITAHLDPSRAYQIPIAHAEGRYYCDESTLKSLKANQQILFQYCDARGEVSPAANPNGSLEAIAGICNATRNVMGMMPHPERAADVLLGNTDGRLLFESLIATQIIRQSVG